MELFPPPATLAPNGPPTIPSSSCITLFVLFFPFALFRSLYLIVFPQMIDKIWFDWQNKLPMNKFAYEGGSVAELTNFTLSTIFPNGGPPFLNVSALPHLKLACFLM